MRKILDDYPGLIHADVLACVTFGAEVARELYVDVPLEPAA